MSTRGFRSRFATASVVAVALSGALAGCQQGSSTDKADSTSGGSSPDKSTGDQGAVVAPSKAPAPTSVANVTANVSKGQKNVRVDTPVTVQVDDGTFDKVAVTAGAKKRPLLGSFNQAKTRWTAGDLLEPGTTYDVNAKASDSKGLATQSRTQFRTENLTLDQQTYPSLTPLSNEVVGVGMPVIVQFDVPVSDRAAIERQLDVTAQPATPGSWSWLSDQEVHWRPKTYWKSGTKVHVDVDINGVDAGNGIYGQMDRQLDFKVGQSVIMQTNLATDQMKVRVDHTVARTIPVTGGKAGFETRSGTKLIIEKFESKQMDAATIGIEPGDPEYYNIPEVQYAQRVTFTGEFLHAAPWSVGDQGYANVSHGCVGMSPEDGAWLFERTHRGDPVEVTGTQRGLEQGNGWTDWDISFKEFQQGSAL